jgi:hypothetical protein
LTKEFAAKEKLEIVLSALVQGEAGGRDSYEQIAASRKQGAQFWNPGSYLSAHQINSNKNMRDFFNTIDQKFAYNVDS